MTKEKLYIFSKTLNYLRNYTILCKTLDSCLISLYFAQKMRNGCSDLLKRASIRRNPIL